MRSNHDTRAARDTWGSGQGTVESQRSAADFQNSQNINRVHGTMPHYFLPHGASRSPSPQISAPSPATGMLAFSRYDAKPPSSLPRRFGCVRGKTYRSGPCTTPSTISLVVVGQDSSHRENAHAEAKRDGTRPASARSVKGRNHIKMGAIGLTSQVVVLYCNVASFLCAEMQTFDTGTKACLATTRNQHRAVPEPYLQKNRLKLRR